MEREAGWVTDRRKMLRKGEARIKTRVKQFRNSGGVKKDVEAIG